MDVVQWTGGWRFRSDVPFEFICEVARARALAEAGHVESGAAAARHVGGAGVDERRVCWRWAVDGWVVVVLVARESGMSDGRTEDDGRKELLALAQLQAQPLSERSAGTEAAMHVTSRAKTPRHSIAMLRVRTVVLSSCIDKCILTRLTSEE
jgi:hypothetical protein